MTNGYAYGVCVTQSEGPEYKRLVIVGRMRTHLFLYIEIRGPSTAPSNGAGDGGHLEPAARTSLCGGCQM